TLAREVAAQFDVPRAYAEPLELLQDRGVDAVVIVSPTHTHRTLVVEAMNARKPTFCEKPPAISLIEAADMAEAVERSGAFFQMGFMRRFDPGYAAAERQMGEGRVGSDVRVELQTQDAYPRE